MRKFVILFCTLLLLCSLALPAFASTSGGNVGNTIYQSGAPIDYITFVSGPQAGSVYDWAFNSAREGAQPIFSFGSTPFSSGASYRDGKISGTFAATGTFDLFTNNLIVTQNYNMILSNYYDDDPISFLEISVSGKCVYIQGDTDSKNYDMVEKPFSRIYTNFVGGSVDIGQLVRDQVAFTNGTTSVGLSPTMVSDLTIRVKYNVEAGYTGNVLIDIEVSTRDRSVLYQQWLDSLDLKAYVYSPGSFDVSDWLEAAVGGFLEFELFPGFSINKIFWLVLVIGIMLWFITLMI